MGAQLTKGEAAVDGKAVADKANGQVRTYKHFLLCIIKLSAFCCV